MSIFENLSEIQKDFVDIIIEIVKHKYESLRETHSDRVLLENITLEPIPSPIIRGLVFVAFDE